MDKLLQRWAELEPSRCWKHSERRIGYVVAFSGATYFANLSHSKAKYQHQNIQAAVQEAIIARPGWGWSKPYMLRNDVQVETDYDLPKQNLFRCTGFATAHCDASLTINLLDAYLQALEAN